MTKTNGLLLRALETSNFILKSLITKMNTLFHLPYIFYMSIMSETKGVTQIRSQETIISIELMFNGMLKTVNLIES